LMEQGVEPLARLIWGPSQPRPSTPKETRSRPADQDRAAPALNDRAPLREPPITADPLVLQEPVIRMLPEPEEASPPDVTADDGASRLFEPLIPLPPDLPPPLLLDQMPGTGDAERETSAFPELPALPEQAPRPPELPALPMTPSESTDEF